MKKTLNLRRDGSLLSRKAFLRGAASGLATASMTPLLGSAVADEPFIAADASIVCTLRNAKIEADLLVLTTAGNLLYNHRVVDGNLGEFGPWHSYVDVTAAAGNAGKIIGADIAWNVAGLQVIAATDDGGVWHTVLNNRGTWSPFADVKKATGNNPGQAVNVTGVEVPDLNVHYGVVTSDGNLFHTIRRADGVWAPFGNVKAEASNPGTIIDTDFGIGGFDLQVVALTDNGGAYHTIRHGNGSWDPFGDIRKEVGIGVGALVDVTCAGFPFELHVGVVSGVTPNNILPGDLFHTRRFAFGNWQRGWNDIDLLAGDPGEIVAADFASDDQKYIHATVVTTDGTVWYTFRYPPPNSDESWLAYRKVIPGRG